MNLERLSKLLNTANHPSSADAERTMAARTVCKMLADKDVQRLFGSAQHPSTVQLQADLNAARNEIRQLKATVREHEAATLKAKQAEERARIRAKAAQQEAKKLAREVKALRTELAKAKAQQAPATSDHVPWADVEIAITEGTDGHVSGLGMTALHLGIPVKVLLAWRTVGQLPRDLYVEIATMAPGARPSRARWSPQEMTMLRRLAHHEPVEIARRIGAKVGRLILETSVIRMAKLLEIRLGAGVPSHPRRPASRAVPNQTPQQSAPSARPARRAA